MGRRAPHRMGNGPQEVRLPLPVPRLRRAGKPSFLERVKAATISALAWAPAWVSVHPVEQGLKPAEQASEAV